jgi:adenosylcobyric acid synthase
MQMLGEQITDPLGMEQEGSVSGLGLLPIRTVMQADKVTRNVTGNLIARTLFGQPVAESWLSGYEIHIGQTFYQTGAVPFAVLSSGGHNDGCMSTDTRVFGTYLHGLFDNDNFRHQFLRAARSFHKLAAPDELSLWKRLREASLNRLAREVEKALDMKTMFGWVGLPYEDNGGTKENDRSQIQGVMR